MAKGICSVEGCERPLRARGWCEAHYRRWKKTGHTGAVEVRPPNRSNLPGQRCSVEGCERASATRGWCMAHYNRWLRFGDPGEADIAPHWKGEDVGYAAAHYRIRKAKGHASGHACVGCGGPAKDWAYDHADLNALSEVNANGFEMRYSLDPKHYIPMCKACHTRFDKN